MSDDDAADASTQEPEPDEAYPDGCPRCGAPTSRVTLDGVPGETFAVCTNCNWGED